MKSGKLVGTLGERFHRKLRFESLESRRLLAAITPVSNTSTFPNSAAVQFHTHWDRNGNGTIDANELTTCSGTLVSDYQVLTAGHCLYDSERGGWASDVYVHAGRLSEHNRPWGEAAGVQFHVHPGYLRTESKFYDVGIVVLDRNLGDFTGHFGIGTLQNPLHKNTPKPPYAVDLQVLHYPAKHSNNGVDYTGSVQQ
jgi:V8-like Glu-specific endopeptidase